MALIVLDQIGEREARQALPLGLIEPVDRLVLANDAVATRCR